MSTEARVRRMVARRVWRTNPHSTELASVAVSMAQVMDTGGASPGLADALRTTLSHLVDCGPVPDDLDQIRGRYARRQLQLFAPDGLPVRQASDLQLCTGPGGADPTHTLS